MTRIEIIHSVEDLVDWVGCYVNDQLARVSPVFHNDVSELSKGCILLVDLARELTTVNNYKHGKLSTPNIDNLGSHINNQFGSEGYRLVNSFIGKPIGTVGARLVAKELHKVIRVNYLESQNRIEQDKSRIRLDGKHLLTKIDSGTTLVNLAQLAQWLGSRYVEIECSLSKYNVAK